MSNLTADLNYSDANHANRVEWPYQLTNSLTVYKGSALGTTSTGYAVKWADTAGYKFKGISARGAVGDTSATPPVEAEIVQGAILKRLTVTGASAITDIDSYVYLSTDNPDDVTLTSTVNVGPVGQIVRYYGGTTCDVRFFSPEEYLAHSRAGAWSFQIDLASVADGDVVTAFEPGFAGRITDAQFVVNVPVTTGSKLSTLNVEIDTTNLTGGTIALTSANCTPIGAIIDAAAITAGNAFTASNTISVEASSTTAFAEGSGTLVITYEAI